MLSLLLPFSLPAQLCANAPQPPGAAHTQLCTLRSLWGPHSDGFLVALRFFMHQMPSEPKKSSRHTQHPAPEVRQLRTIS